MNIVAMLARKFSLSARYFSPSANVSNDNCTNLKGTHCNNGSMNKLWFKKRQKNE